jgi:hypothetical protein
MDKEEFFRLSLEYMKLIHVFGVEWSKRRKRIKNIRSTGIHTANH